MSWKSVEMQVALPRTQDAGKMQEQMSKQQQRFQETLAQHQLREDIIKRRKVREYEETKGKKVTEDEENDQGLTDDTDHEESSDKKGTQEQSTVDHPYLGQHIDFSR